jgi:hypothetical protein
MGAGTDATSTQRIVVIVVVGPEQLGDPGRRRAGPSSRPSDRAGGSLAVEAVEAGGDDRDADLVAHLVVDDGAEDDVGVLVCDAVDDLGGGVHLEQAHPGRTGDVQQHAAGAVDGRFEQRARDRGLGGRDARSSPLACRCPSGPSRRSTAPS